MIYLYAVTEACKQELRCPGLDATTVERAEMEELCIAYSTHADGFEAPVTAAALWTHEAVVDELLEWGAVIPFRFGTTLPTVAAAQDLLNRHAQRFKHTLSELRDRVELAVRVDLPDAAAPAGGDGTAYLTQLRAHERVAEALLKPLDVLAAASTHHAVDRTRVLRASYLVPREDVDSFTAVVRALQEDHPDLSLSCTGPWAPYSFVGESQRDS
jgi:hypothetical protein